MTNREKPKKRKQVILSVYPNFRGFGYAIMEEPLKVLDAQIVSIRPVSNKMTLKRVKEIIDYYNSKIIVLEDYTGIGSRKSKRIQKLINSITQYAQKKELTVKTYSRADIRFAFSNFNAHTKHEIATAISESIPFMKNKLQEKRKASETEKYSTGAFDAVSLGITYFYLGD